MGLAESVETLFALRLLQGILSGFVAATTGFVATETPPQRVGYALGVLQSAAAGGSVIGPLVGGIISDAVGMRWTFFAVSILCVTSGGLVWGFLREHRRPTAQGDFSLVVPLRHVMKTPAMVSLIAGIVAVQAAMMLPAPVFPLYLEHLGAPRWLLSTFTGLSVGIAGALMAAASPLWARCAEQYGYRRILLLCTALAAVVYAAQAMAPHYELVIFLRALTGVTVAGIVPLLYTLLGHSAPVSLRSSIIGIGSSCDPGGQSPRSSTWQHACSIGGNRVGVCRFGSSHGGSLIGELSRALGTASATTFADRAWVSPQEAREFLAGVGSCPGKSGTPALGSWERDVAMSGGYGSPHLPCGAGGGAGVS